MSFKVSYDKDTLNLQKLGEIVYEKTDLADFRSNSDSKSLVDYIWQNASNNESVLTFDFKGKNIELENLPYEGDINATQSNDAEFTFCRDHNIIYGEIDTAIKNSSTDINESNMYKITFNGKLKLPKFSAGLFTIYWKSDPSTLKFIREIDLTNVDMNNIVNSTCMFHGCSGLIALDLSKFTGENLTNAEEMFLSCSSITALDLSSFTGENLVNITHMFTWCEKLTSLSLPKFTGENATDAMEMFSNCTNLNSLDLRKFTGEKLTNASNMFYGCENLNSLIMKGSAINTIVGLSYSRLSLDTGVTVNNDKTYRCTCTYDNDHGSVKITEVQEISA